MRSADGWFDRLVGLDGEDFIFTAGKERMDHLVPASWVTAAQGAMIETSPAAVALMAEIARRLKEQGGAALVIDYGHMELRSGSTMQALKSHKKVDIFAHPGDSDLTAHVDFELLQQVAADNGADVMGLQYQGEWLRQMGIDTRTEALQRRNPYEKDTIKRQRDRLVGFADGHLVQGARDMWAALAVRGGVRLMMRLRRMILVAGLALAVPASAAEPVAGRWLTAEKDAVILIAPCGKTMCGTIEKFLVPRRRAMISVTSTTPTPASANAACSASRSCPPSRQMAMCGAGKSTTPRAAKATAR